MNNPLVKQEEVALRMDDSNVNHHRWNNNGTWWIHYTIYPTSVTAERVRYSLKTKNLTEARSLRNQIFKKFLNHTCRLAA